jgi:DNA polymerase III subunit beta
MLYFFWDDSGNFKEEQMHLSCLQENLRRGLARVGRSVASKSTLPVLSHVLLATDTGRLKLAATNLELGMTTWIGAKVTTEGAITVPARLLIDIINSLPNQVIDLSLDPIRQTLHLRCADAAIAIKGIEANEFPTIPAIQPDATTAIVPANLLREGIDQVAFAAAIDDTRPILTGVALHISGQHLSLISSDGFRLAQRTICLPQSIPSPINGIIPARALIELARNISESTADVQVSLTPTGGQITFQTDNFELVSRLIEGKYPDVHRIIPQQFQTRAVLDRQQIVQAMKLASYIATAATNVVTLRLEPGAEHTLGKLTITATAAEVGEHQAVHEGTIVGDGGQILLNIGYVVDALQAMTTPQLAVELQTGQNPAVFKPVGMSDYVCVIMPMHVR